MSVPSDDELVAAVTAGDRDSFALLVTRYAGSAIGVAAQILGDRHAAEDVAQEALAVAYTKLNTLKNKTAFGSWLLQIVRRQALKARERRRRFPQLRENSPEPTTEDSAPLNEDRQQLLNLIEQLPERERVIVMLRYFDNHTIDEIAGITGSTAGTITKTLTRARQRLLSLRERSMS